MSGKAGGADGLPSRRRVPRRILVAVLAVWRLLLTVVAKYELIRARQDQVLAFTRPSGIPATVPTSLANLMQLSPVSDHGALDFTLTDQSGHDVSGPAPL